ncbi:MAG: hypothetical protein ACOYBE_06065 [Blautia sp.]|jgi:hypothetical protein
MVKWYRDLYVGEGVGKKAKKTAERIEKGKAAPGIYLVTLADHPDNILEILPASLLLQKTARRICPLIVGMAKGKEEAVLLTQRIIEETYQETGSFRVEEFIQDR